MKTLFGISHFFKNNTPKLWQIIGDLGLFVAALSAFIMALPGLMASVGITGFVLPAYLVTINQYCLGIGAMIKFISKFFGHEMPATNPVINPADLPVNNNGTH